MTDTEEAGEIEEVEKERAESGEEAVAGEKRWLELVHRKREKVPVADGLVY